MDPVSAALPKKSSKNHHCNSGTGGGVAHVHADHPLRADLVWVATDDARILIYAAADPDKSVEVGRISLPDDCCSMVYTCNKV